jgi:hypothetical protein
VFADGEEERTLRAVRASLDEKMVVGSIRPTSRRVNTVSLVSLECEL